MRFASLASLVVLLPIFSTGVICGCKKPTVNVEPPKAPQVPVQAAEPPPPPPPPPLDPGSVLVTVKYWGGPLFRDNPVVRQDDNALLILKPKSFDERLPYTPYIEAYLSNHHLVLKQWESTSHRWQQSKSDSIRRSIQEAGLRRPPSNLFSFVFATKTDTSGQGVLAKVPPGDYLLLIISRNARGDYDLAERRQIEKHIAVPGDTSLTEEVGIIEVTVASGKETTIQHQFRNARGLNP